MAREAYLGGSDRSTRQRGPCKRFLCVLPQRPACACTHRWTRAASATGRPSRRQKSQRPRCWSSGRVPWKGRAKVGASQCADLFVACRERRPGLLGSAWPHSRTGVTGWGGWEAASAEAVVIPGVWQMGIGSGLATRERGCEAGHRFQEGWMPSLLRRAGHVRQSPTRGSHVRTWSVLCHERLPWPRLPQSWWRGQRGPGLES